MIHGDGSIRRQGVEMARRASDNEEALLNRTGSSGGSEPIVFEATAGAPVVLPDGQFLTDASYLQ